MSVHWFQYNRFFFWPHIKSNKIDFIVCLSSSHKYSNMYCSFFIGALFWINFYKNTMPAALCCFDFIIQSLCVFLVQRTSIFPYITERMYINVILTFKLFSGVSTWTVKVVVPVSNKVHHVTWPLSAEDKNRLWAGTKRRRQWMNIIYVMLFSEIMTLL